GLAAKRLGLTPVPVDGAEELKGRRYRPIGAWTRSQPVGCQGDISTFLFCSKGARRWAPMTAPPRLRSPTGTRQTRQCLRYSAEGSCPSGPSSGFRKTNRNFIDQQCAHAVPSLTGKVPRSLPQRSRDRPTALKFFLGSTISLRRQYSPEHICGQPRFV